MASRSNRPDFNRRKLLGLIGMGGAVGIAGCIGDDDGDGEPGPTPTPGETPTETPVDPDEITEGGTLRVAVAENINSFDPPYSLDTTSTLGQSFLYEGLTTTGSDGTVYPWLAESYEITEVNDVAATEDYADYSVPIEEAEADGAQFVWTTQVDDMVMTTETAADAVADGVFGMEFVFTLHEGVEFHNGDEVTADDVVASYRRYEHSMVDDQVYDDIMYVTAEGDYEVRVYLVEPDPEGIRNVGMTVIPQNQAELDGGALDPREGTVPVGTGPWVFEEFEDASHYVVTKNEDYWLETKGLDTLPWWDGPADFPASPVLDEVNMDLIPSDPTRTAALLNDEVDYTYGVSSDILNDFEASADYRVVSTTAGGYDYIQFPIQVEPWDNEKLRNAVNHLIPREIIANDIFEGWRVPAWAPLPELARGTGTVDADALLDDLRPRNEYDPDRADELMQEFVDETGVSTPIEIQVETNADNDDRVSTNELIVESMNGSGWFDATLETHEWGAYLGRILNTDYQHRGHIYYVGLSAGFNPASYCEATHDPLAVGGCCNANGVHWDDLTELMRRASSGMEVMDDPELRAELYDDIWDIITQRHGTVYTVFSTNSSVMHNRVRGFREHPNVQARMSYGLHAPTDQVVTWLDPDL